MASICATKIKYDTESFDIFCRVICRCRVGGGGGEQEGKRE